MLGSFGALVSSVTASIPLLVFGISTFLVTVFIVEAGAGLAGYSPSGDFVALSAAVLATGAVVGGASPTSGVGSAE